MAKAVGSDVYPNIIVGRLTMSAANTLTFSEINVGLNLFDKAALLIQRIELTPSTTALADLDTDVDNFTFGLTASNQLADLQVDRAEVIDTVQVEADLIGAVVSKQLHVCPWIHDFSGLRGGGILIPPKPLYAAGVSFGMTIAGVFFWRLYMNVIRLQPDEYLELLETRRAFG